MSQADPTHLCPNDGVPLQEFVEDVFVCPFCEVAFPLRYLQDPRRP